MLTPLALFEFVAKAALNHVGFGVAGDLAVEVLPSVARDVWDWWAGEKEPADLRGELQAVAQLDDVQASRLAEQAVAEVAPQQPPLRRQQAAAWLARMPAVVRATQRRPADPSGRTVSPAFPLDKPADLLPLLPARMPRFAGGDRPASLGGDWTLDELLGTGGFGEVWKASHASLPPWAVKFCLDGAAVRSLRHEATLLGRVIREGTHPGIVRLMHTALNADPPLLAYEFVSGGELTALAREWAVRPPKDHVGAAAQLMRRLCDVVAFAHRLKPAIVHRDLKPANVLLEPTAGGVVPRVADFGIGGVAAERGSGHTLATMLSGSHTPLYASPQQKKGERPDPRDDVHALGVVWLHLLTGDLALEPGYWRDALQGREVPAAMLELLGACLAYSPAARPADAGEMEARLTAALSKPATPLLPQAPPPPQPPPAAVQKESRFGKGIGALTGTPAAHTEARRLLGLHDYAAAVAALEVLPMQLRDQELYSTLVSRRDELVALEKRIQSAIDAGRFVGLAPSVERLLQLTPNDAEAKELLASLPPMPREIVNSIGMKFVLVQPGKFLMGSPANEAVRQANEEQHEVEITKPFYLAVFQTTQAHFERVMGSNPSNWKGPSRPVEQVTWDEAVEFCKRLSKMGAETASERLYRLPTEAEWEYSCRGGSSGNTGPFHFKGQSTSALSSNQANFHGDYPYGGATKGPNRGQTTDVGSFEANALGLFDMHGNVWEWCADWYEENYYKQSPRRDPQGPQNGQTRVRRGGAWDNGGHYCRAACRNCNAPGARYLDFGFRVALCLS